jgi:CheY-like chemotaxis protein/DNA-directed RNA polymerase specialized sigma24 family protein
MVTVVSEEAVMSVSDAIAGQIPYLRRFARALAGNQESGDSYVVAALEALIADRSLVGEDDTRVALYRLLLTVWDSLTINRRKPPPEAEPSQSGPEYSLQAISPRPREAFLLTGLEGFSEKDAARIMRVSEESCTHFLEIAGQEIAAQMACEVLIIEDEPLIALDLAELAKSMGHTISHVARTHREAIELVAKHPPNLVLADIQLADGSSGIDAVRDILKSISVPVIFVTAYPERLLTGERPEPTYLISKPFRPEAMRALISQALFFHPRRP